jgi:hypothetical protein
MLLTNLNSSRIYRPSFSMPLVFLDFVSVAVNELDKNVLKHGIYVLQNDRSQPSP